MSIIDLKSQESITSTKDCCYMNKAKEVLLLGQNYNRDYIIYLYFKLPPYSYLKQLKQARLILFKLPGKYGSNQGDCNDISQKYSVSPLLEFFSPYSCIFCPPNVDFSKEIYFDDKECGSYTDVDITDIVKSWIGEKIENKGLVLMANEDARLITYASRENNIKGIRPKLRLIYEESGKCQTLTSAPCSVKISN